MDAADFRKLRKELGWTQVKLAKQLDVKPDTIISWESGRRKISGPGAKLLLLITILESMKPSMLEMMERTLAEIRDLTVAYPGKKGGNAP